MDEKIKLYRLAKEIAKALHMRSVGNLLYTYNGINHVFCDDDTLSRLIFEIGFKDNPDDATPKIITDISRLIKMLPEISEDTKSENYLWVFNNTAVDPMTEKTYELSYEKKIEFYTAEQCNKLLDVTLGSPLHDIVLITFLYGLRRSEVMGLRWCDIDFENNTVTIQHTRVLQKVVVSKDKTKNASSNRVYPLLDEVKTILLKIKSKQQRNKKTLELAYTDSGYVFVNEHGEPFYPSYPTRRLAHFIKKYELPHIRFHDLRHPYVKLKLKNLFNLFYRHIQTEVLNFPYYLNSFIGVNKHFINEHICQALC